MSTDRTEYGIYSQIASGEGIRARDIAKELHIDRKTVNHYLYRSPYMRDLCYQDKDYRWHALIRQGRPHLGLVDYSGYYGTVKEFLELTEDEWFEMLLAGCKRIGRNLNDTRGLFHSFRDAREVMCSLFADLDTMGADKVEYETWEIVFELRIRRSRYIRIYADVLVVTDRYVFSLEFKMKDKIDPNELSQAAKYSSYLEVIFGPEYEVIPVLVLTRAEDLYRYEKFGGTTAEVPVCSGDMLFNVLDEYQGIMKESDER